MIILTLIVLFIDIISKLIVKHYLTLGNSIHVIKNFFDFTYVRNTGVAWSFLDGNRYLVLVMSGLIICGIIYYAYKERPNRELTKYAYALILGGAIGNFLDRVFYGYVIDFFDFKIFGYNYPIFNMADVFIAMGVILLMYDAWRCNSGNKGYR